MRCFRVRKALMPVGVVVMTAALFWCAPVSAETWKFVIAGDSRGSSSSLEVSPIVADMAPAIANDSPELVLYTGDLVHGYPATQAAFQEWKAAMAPVYDAGILVYPVRGNHDKGTGWIEEFGADIPDDGPAGEINFTYSFTHRNALFIGLDQYIVQSRVNQAWLDGVLAGNTMPHVFTFGHEMAFKVAFHRDNLDNYPTPRDVFWRSLLDVGSRVYFCGHDHYYDHTRVGDGDGDPDDDIHQYIVGSGGAPLYAGNPVYDGANGSWIPTNVHHELEYGYVLAEVDGADVTLTWKHRVAPGVYQAAEVLTYNALPAHTASHPAPADGSVLVAVDTNLSWRAAAIAVSHNVYLGTNETAVSQASASSPQFRPNQVFQVFDPGWLALETAYFWRIDEVTPYGTATGGVWRLSTVPKRPVVDNPVALHMVTNYSRTTNLAAGAVWKYLDDGSDQGTNWYAVGFDDDAWASGAAQLGYGESDQVTTVGYGTNDLDKYVTTYFRTEFVIPRGVHYASSVAQLLRDDGAIVYLNGREIARSNMQTGPIGFETYALTTVSDAAEGLFLDTSSYYTPSTETEAKRLGWLSTTLMRRPLRLP